MSAACSPDPPRQGVPHQANRDIRVALDRAATAIQAMARALDSRRSIPTARNDMEEARSHLADALDRAATAIQAMAQSDE